MAKIKNVYWDACAWLGMLNGEPKRQRELQISSKIEGMMLINGVRYLKSLTELGVEPPYAVLLSLIGVKGAAINVGIQANWADDDDITILDRDQLHFTEVILETVPRSNQELKA